MNTFLVHGTFGKPFENWFPWFENELSLLEIPCTIPTFPTPQHQNYADWEKLMDYYCEIGMVNEDTVLIGHSCGAIFLVHYLLVHQKKIKGLICVSGYNNFISGYKLMDDLNCSFYTEAENMNMKRYADKVIAFYGDNDPNIPQIHLQSFAEAIGGETYCVNNAGHFNASAGYTKCFEVLKAVKTCFGK